MPSLLDIQAPEQQRVEADCSRGAVLVQPVPAEVWASLYRRYPVLVQVMQGGGAVNVEAIGINGMVDAFDAMAALVAASAALADGAEWDSKAHFDKASTLTIDDVTAVMAKVTQISYPAEYMRPLRDLLKEQAAAQGGKEPATSS